MKQRIRIIVALVVWLAAARTPAEVVWANSPFGPLLADAGSSNRLALVSDGYDALLVRVHLIRNATRSLDLQTFIWTDDECGRLMMYELIQAARRGVRVRIIADQLASEKDPRTVAFLATAHTNLSIKHYRPPLRRLDPNWYQTVWNTISGFGALNQRMHNKVMIADDAVLITGGRNIENSYFNCATEMNFRDRDVLAVGPVVADAVASFETYWDYHHAVSSRKLTDVAAAIRKGKHPRPETREDFAFNGYFTDLDGLVDSPDAMRARFVDRLLPVARVRFIADPPGKGGGLFSRTRTRIVHDLRDAIEQARTSIVMQTPYFVISDPAAKLFAALKRKHKGLRIRASTNSFASTDNLFAYSANYRKRESYVGGIGVEIHEFRPHPAHLLELFPQYPAMQQRADARIRSGEQQRGAFLCVHAKSMVIDGRVAFVGSYNLDPRSERLNTEVGLLVEDPAFAGALQAEIERDMRDDASWVIARRVLPLRLDVVNGMVDGVLSLSPIDLWPIQNTTSFERKPGAAEVPPGHADFYRNYRETGAFPGTEGALSQKEVMTRLYKAVGSAFTPLL